jgi:ribosomal protein L12E/L44/L45/RPP1/RPP2
MSAVDNLIQQILASSNTAKWKGEGFGSAEANAADMAKLLNEIGITDIKQFGLINKTVDEEVQPDGQGGFIDSKGRPVDPKLVKEESQSGESNDRVFYTAPTGTTQAYGNKVTGQEIGNSYGERQNENAWGGTYTGEGNTAYRVYIDAQGNPQFYTTAASSNDLANLMQDFGPIGQIGLAIATGGLSIPQQIAANFALQVLSGKDIGDAMKGAAASYAMSKLPGMDVMKESSKFLNGLDDTGILSSTFKNAAMSGAKALITGKDFGEALRTGALTGGVNGALNAMLDTSDFKELTKDLSASQTKMVVNAVTGAISGKPLDQIVINTAMSAARDAAAAERAKNESDVIDPYFKKNTTKVADAEDSITLPSGIQLAGVNTGTMSDAGNGAFKLENTGTPLFAESKGADKLQLPYGTRLMSQSEETSDVDSETGKTVYKKPENAYYDASINAWLVKEDPNQFFTSESVANDMALFNSSQGDLKDAASTTASTSDDYLADFLKSMGITSTDDLYARELTAQDILDMANQKSNTTDSTLSGNKTADEGTLTVTGKKETDGVNLDTGLDVNKVTDMGTTTVTAKRPVTQELDLSVEPIKLDVADLTLADIVADTTKVDDKTKVTTPDKVVIPNKVATPTPETPFVPTGQVPPPSQDPYAKVKFMEDIFGPELSNQFLTDVSMQTPKSNDLEALLRALRG